RIPPFQRGFKWEATDVVKLFDSIVRGFPIGNLLLWRRPAPQQRIQVGPLEVHAPAIDSGLWVVDGQQRIISLVGALTSAESATDSRFRVHLDIESGQFHTAGARQLPPVSWIPVSVLPDTTRLLAWMRSNTDWLQSEQMARLEQAAKAIREYQIPTYVVSSADEEQLVEIFARMNTSGKPLTKPEVFHALHSGMSPEEPTDLHSLSQSTAQLGFGPIDERIALRCVLAFRGGDIFRDAFEDEFSSTQERIDTFREVAGLLSEAVQFLRGECAIPHVRLLPYSHVITILVRFARLHGAPSGRAATLLRRWVWRGAVAGTRAKGISVSDVRGQVFVVDASTDPLHAAQALLALVRQYPDFAPDLHKVHFRDAMAKISTLGLLSAEPRELDTGELVDVAGLLAARSPLHPILPDRSHPLSHTMANRAVASPGRGRLLRALITQASAVIAGSHLVDEKAKRLLLDERLSEFLEYRRDAVEKVVVGHVGDMAEWGARDGRAISDIVRTVA
ncbi:MAG TPA: DUF262 domain-containing protein, partial [Pseudonocardiaceae bacterium]|nr:DUF262 domain-containing protein [Pseudonocardiaceae bacterium]